VSDEPSFLATSLTSHSIVPFLNGAHDVEEISFRSGLSRRDVRVTLERFKENLARFRMAV